MDGLLDEPRPGQPRKLSDAQIEQVIVRTLESKPVERSFAWAARFRRLARDYERLDATLKGFHYLCFACIMLARVFHLLNPTS